MSEVLIITMLYLSLYPNPVSAFQMLITEQSNTRLSIVLYSVLLAGLVDMIFVSTEACGDRYLSN